MEEIGITIIGAGVIGLAAGWQISTTTPDVFIIEKNSSFGQETSSRNSEVIHAGIYYPKNSLKAKTCVEGKQLLYEFCQKHNVAYRPLGKLIIASNSDEITKLQETIKTAAQNNVPDLNFLNQEEIKKLEPRITAKAAIYSPSTGIIDSHSLMKTLSTLFKNNGGEVVYNSEVTSIKKTSGGFKIQINENSANTPTTFLTKIVINCAGLNSYQISKLAGIDREEYRLKYCKGDYFRVHNNKAKFLNHLIYPAPKDKSAGLGIHATLDLAGGLRLGPDDEYITNLNYAIKESKKTAFYENVKSFLPFIELKDLSADTCGIRPKLQNQGEETQDFIIKEESANNMPGFINLIGIESPGLTACLSIAKIVETMVADYDKK